MQTKGQRLFHWRLLVAGCWLLVLKTAREALCFRLNRCGPGCAVATRPVKPNRAFAELGRTASPRLAVNAVLKQPLTCTPI